MQIEFFKNGITNNSYDVVFQNDALRNYLDSLKDTTSYVSIDIEDIYLTYKGQFTLSFELFIGDANFWSECNYMRMRSRIREGTPQTGFDRLIYAFITSSEIINGMIVINYQMDLWSTYSPIMAIKNSTLIRTISSNVLGNSIKELIPPELPQSYNTDFDVDYTNSSKNYRIFLIMQIYTLDASGVKTSREQFCVQALWHIDGVNKNYQDFTYDDIQTILSNQTDTKITRIKPNSPNKEYYYDLIELYTIPIVWDIGYSDIDTQNQTHYEMKITDTVTYKFYDPNLRTTLNDGTIGNITTPQSLNRIQKDIFDISISDDANINDIIDYLSIIGVGNINHEFENDKTIVRGATQKLQVEIFANKQSFNIYFVFNGNRVDITSDYEYIFPYVTETAQNYIQAKYNRMYENKTSTIQYANSLLNNLRNSFFSARQGATNALSDIADGNIYSAVNRGYANINTQMGAIQNVAIQTALYKLSIERINLKAYQTAYANTQGISDNFAVVGYGNTKRILKDVYNKNKIINLIRSIGYGCNQTISGSLLNTGNPDTPCAQYENENSQIVHNHRNFIQFANVYIEGDATSDIKLFFKNLLERGVMIYYDGEV